METWSVAAAAPGWWQGQTTYSCKNRKASQRISTSRWLGWHSLVPCTCVSPFPWRRSLWPPPPGSRAGSSSPWRSEAEAGCCSASPAFPWRRAARRPASALGEDQVCFLGGRGCCRAPRPGRSGAARPCCAGPRWRPGAGRRCGAEGGGRRPPPRLNRRGRRTRPNSGTRNPRCPEHTENGIKYN